MSEYFDMVDHNDQVIGKVSRKQAHQFNLMHRAVHIFLQDQQGKWLLQKRSQKKMWTHSYGLLVVPVMLILVNLI